MRWIRRGRWFGRPPIPPTKDVLPVLSAADLLTTPSRIAQVRDIARLAGLPSAHFDTLYRRALESFAGWVQQLPASEAHHHAGPGGLLDHALEVAVGAMAKRRVHLLPPGADPETIARQQHRWTYAIFSAALLHDIGKPAVDHRIQLIDEARREHGPWDPWNGPMPLGLWYRVTFVRERGYRLHQIVSPLLARLILPPQGLTWLAQDWEVLTEWLSAIGGDRENRGIVAEIVEQADGASVARNLGAGDVTRFPTARAIPLHERLLTALRHLLSTGDLPLNRNGAAGWLVDHDLWVVSKRVADALRDHLTQEGHHGVPTRNERIFDVLQEHQIVIPNGERAIWSADVSAEGWSHRFTLLRFRASRVWPDSTNRPHAFIGAVVPSAAGAEDDHAERGATTPPRPEPAETAVTPANEHSVHSPMLTSQPRSIEQSNEAENLGESFLVWLREGTTQGRLRINRVDARIHVVPEGLLLVSPGIFKDYAAAIRQPPLWDRIQKAFCRLDLHRRNENNSNIWHYKIELADGNHGGTSPTLKGIVVKDIGDVLQEEIPANPVLRRVDPAP